jgi:hypothetical protein
LPQEESETATEQCRYRVPTAKKNLQYQSASKKMIDIMISNGAKNVQWLMAGTKKNNKAAGRCIILADLVISCHLD